MRHYWVIGILCLALYFFTEGARGRLWFQEGSRVSAHATTGETFNWRGDLRDGDVLEIKALNGSITAEGTRGNQVIVTAVTRNNGRTAERIQVEAVPHANGVTICALHFGRNSRPICASGDGGQLGGSQGGSQVNFEVQVPEGIRLVATSMNGSIRAEDMEGDVHAETLNGGITIETVGSATAKTVNGAIVALVGDRRGFRPMSFSSVNGAVTVTLPEDVRAEVLGATTNGSVSSEFEVELAGTRSRTKRFTGILGGGGELIRLQSTNGSIKLLRGN